MCSAAMTSRCSLTEWCWGGGRLPPPPLRLPSGLSPSRPKTPPPLQPALKARSPASPRKGRGAGKTVKFQLPNCSPMSSIASEDDLASIRPDWREAAAANACVACSQVECDGSCTLSAKERKGKREAGLPEAAQKLFSNAEPKTTGALQWTRGELLGEGAYGKVFAGLNQSTGELMAVNQLKLQEGDEKMQHMAALEREIALYRKMRHKHIVGYIDMERDEGTGSLYVFLEFVSGGSIHSMLDRFGKFSEPLVRIYTRQLLLGLEYLHGCKIIHRDIKGGNVLVDGDGVIKLADFGASKVKGVRRGGQAGQCSDWGLGLGFVPGLPRRHVDGRVQVHPRLRLLDGAGSDQGGRVRAASRHLECGVHSHRNADWQPPVARHGQHVDSHLPHRQDHHGAAHPPRLLRGKQGLPPLLLPIGRQGEAHSH